jgi:hypothetical protein
MSAVAPGYSVVAMEVSEPGETADLVLWRLENAFPLSVLHHQGAFEVIVACDDPTQAREEIVAVAFDACPDWLNHLHFAPVS